MNRTTMESAQLAYDNRSDPRLEDDGPEVFTGAWGEKYLLCDDCDYAWILHAGQKMPPHCPCCCSDNYLDKTRMARECRWLMP